MLLVCVVHLQRDFAHLAGPIEVLHHAATAALTHHRMAVLAVVNPLVIALGHGVRRARALDAHAAALGALVRLLSGPGARRARLARRSGVVTAA